MDKLFYEGVVKSYDHEKKKHVVLYNDGDVELLCLEKERWELIDDSRKPKRLNLSTSPPLKGVSPEQKKKSLGGSRQNKKLITLKRGKNSKEKYEAWTKGVSKSKTSTEIFEAEGRVDPYVSHCEPATMFKIDDLDTEEEQIDRVEKSLAGGEESDKDEKSHSGGEQVKDGESSSRDTEVSKEEEVYSGGKQKENVDSTPHDAQGSDEEETYPSEEKHEPDVTREDSREVADEVEKSDSQGNAVKNAQESDEERSRSEEEHEPDLSREYSRERTEVEISDLQGNETDDAESPDKSDRKTSNASDSGEAEISDDETLIMWKRQVWKPVEGK